MFRPMVKTKLSEVLNKNPHIVTEEFKDETLTLQHLLQMVKS